MEQITKIFKFGAIALFCIAIGAFSYRQYCKGFVAKSSAAKSTNPFRPDNNTMYGRMRVSSSTSLTLSTTPQTIVWNGTSALGLNVNTFPSDPMGSGNPLITNNTTTGLFTFYNPADVNYFALFTCNVTSTLLTTPVNLRIRFRIPNGVTSGTDLYFPDPDVAKYADLGPCSYISATAFNIVIPVYISQAIRTNGLAVQVFISNTSLGTITLTSATMLMQSGSPIN